MLKNFKKRFRQGTLNDFIHIRKMPKGMKDSSSSVTKTMINSQGDSSNPVSSGSADHQDPNLEANLVTTTPKTEEQLNSNLEKPDEQVINSTESQENDIHSSEEIVVSETDSLDSTFSLNTSTDDLKRYTQFPPSLPPLRSTEDHSVLFNYNTLPDKAPLPYPKSYKDKWDNYHVRLPCSSQSLYPVKNTLTGETELQSRWEIIQCALKTPIFTSNDLEEAILTYNSQYCTHWNFKGLHKLLNEHLEASETKDFFENLLPKMINLCLQIPEVCTQPIPLLKSGHSHGITVSQKQIACLLANAFFCTFPRRNKQNRNSEYNSYPAINFNTLFDIVGRPNKIEKLKCLINYFRRVTKEEPTGVLTFHRQCVKDFPSWEESNKPLSNLCVQSEGLIEVDGMGMLQIDFANMFVGGGVLKSGCVQEEIRFIICPELIVSRLFTERLDKNEALIVTGCEQFNQHTGYAESFHWDGNFEDCLPRDTWGRKLTRVVAIDALRFNRGTDQFSPELLQRELEKAYSGFLEHSECDFLPAVATGNWGCGAFRGDPRLKALIQLMSASEIGRDLLYLTFRDKNLEKDLKRMYSIFKNRNVTVGQLTKMLKDYYERVVKIKGKESLYSFLFQRCTDSDSETELESQS